jgi:hypothetical protein
VEEETGEEIHQQEYGRERKGQLATGEYQWGLDAGDHQDAWNPYNGLPCHWIHADRVENYDNDKRVSDTLMLLDN